MNDHDGYVICKRCNGIGCLKCNQKGAIPMFARRIRLFARREPLAVALGAAALICVAIWFAMVWYLT